MSAGSRSASGTPEREPPNGRSLARALALLAASGLASVAASAFIAARFPQRPAPRDLLFELLPHRADARFVMAFALGAALALFAAHALVAARERLPGFVSIFALTYLLRAALICLTPLADAHGEGPFLVPLVQHGMFPSGHSAASLLCVLLTDAGRAPRLRQLLLALAATVWLTLLLAHGHYSIDVAGGLLLAYFCEREWNRGTWFDPVKRAIGPGA